jgi:hypothetical protein
MQNHEQKKKVKKSEKPRSYGQNKLPKPHGCIRVLFWLQNKEGFSLVGIFMEETTLTCLERHSNAKKRTFGCM